MKPTLLVLAAGMGSRYGGLKQMDGLGPDGETIIDYSIYDAVQSGFGKVVYVVRSSFKDQFEQLVKEKYSHVKCTDGSPLQFEFVIQELDKIPAGLSYNPERQKPWGTAHAVLMAKDVIKEPFAVINGDDYYGKESFHILADWLRGLYQRHLHPNRGRRHLLPASQHPEHHRPGQHHGPDQPNRHHPDLRHPVALPAALFRRDDRLMQDAEILLWHR